MFGGLIQYAYLIREVAEINYLLFYNTYEHREK